MEEINEVYTSKVMVDSNAEVPNDEYVEFESKDDGLNGNIILGIVISVCVIIGIVLGILVGKKAATK